MIDALVLAGSSNKGELVNLGGVRKEALIKIAGIPMVVYVLKVLKQVENIDCICVVGISATEIDQYLETKDILFCETGMDLIDSFDKGCQSLGTDKKHILVLTSDIPLISKEAVNDFLASCRMRDTELFYPIIHRDITETKYPGIKRTYVTLKEGTFTGGNIFLVSSQSINKIIEYGKGFVALRKNPLALAKLLGISFILRYLTGTLSIEHIIDRMRKITGTLGEAVITEYPEIGVDVDKLSDYEVINEFKKKQIS